MERGKKKTEELAAMVEDAAAKLSGEQKTDFLLKIVIFILVALLDCLGSHEEGTTTQFEAEVTYGLPDYITSIINAHKP